MAQTLDKCAKRLYLCKVIRKQLFNHQNLNDMTNAAEIINKATELGATGAEIFNGEIFFTKGGRDLATLKTSFTAQKSYFNANGTEISSDQYKAMRLKEKTMTAIEQDGQIIIDFTNL